MKDPQQIAFSGWKRKEQGALSKMMVLDGSRPRMDKSYKEEVDFRRTCRQKPVGDEIVSVSRFVMALYNSVAGRCKTGASRRVVNLP